MIWLWIQRGIYMSDDCAMDLESGELNFTSGWDSYEDEQDDLW